MAGEFTPPSTSLSKNFFDKQNYRILLATFSMEILSSRRAGSLLDLTQGEYTIKNDLEGWMRNESDSIGRKPHDGGYVG